MQSQFPILTKAQEKEGIHWLTKPIKDSPNSILKLATVAAAIHIHYIPEWNWWPVVGSVSFQRHGGSQDVVRAFIDDGNRLSLHFGKQYPPEPIVVGIDLTSRDPFERHCIRHGLRAKFGINYIDPEVSTNGGSHRKIIVPGDHTHCLDIVFIPDGRCDNAASEDLVGMVCKALTEGRERSWTSTAASSL